jgi:hypothetical protein
VANQASGANGGVEMPGVQRANHRLLAETGRLNARIMSYTQNGLDARDTASSGLRCEPLRKPRPCRRAEGAEAGRNEPAGPRRRARMTKGNGGGPECAEPEESNPKSRTDKPDCSADEGRRHHESHPLQRSPRQAVLFFSNAGHQRCYGCLAPNGRFRRAILLGIRWRRPRFHNVC